MKRFYKAQVKKLDKILKLLLEVSLSSYKNFSESECKDKVVFDCFIGGVKQYLKVLDKRVEIQTNIGDDDPQLTENDVKMIRYFMENVDMQEELEKRPHFIKSEDEIYESGICDAKNNKEENYYPEN